jgi:D-threo-aldose 1-dehydrogenase
MTTPVDCADRVRLGQSDIELTRLGLGTAPLGGLFAAVTEAEATAVVREAVARGIRLFDTAPLYGCGLAEVRLGKALAGVPRTEVVVASKIGRLLKSDAPIAGSRSANDESVFPGSLAASPSL